MRLSLQHLWPASLTWRFLIQKLFLTLPSTGAFHWNCPGRYPKSLWLLGDINLLHLPNPWYTQLNPGSCLIIACWNAIVRFSCLMNKVYIPYSWTLGSTTWPISHDTSCTNQLTFLPSCHSLYPPLYLLNSLLFWAHLMPASYSHFKVQLKCHLFHNFFPVSFIGKHLPLLRCLSISPMLSKK